MRAVEVVRALAPFVRHEAPQPSPLKCRL